MNYPTAEQVRAAVQAAHPDVDVVVSEASHGIDGPTYHVRFAEAGTARQIPEVGA